MIEKLFYLLLFVGMMLLSMLLCPLIAIGYLLLMVYALIKAL